MAVAGRSLSNYIQLKGQLGGGELDGVMKRRAVRFATALLVNISQSEDKGVGIQV